MASKKGSEKTAPGTPAWVVTFADLATLLLTFFVLLISFSNQDIIKFREMLGSVKGAFGTTVWRTGEYQPTLSGSAAKEQEEEKKKEDEKKNDEVKRQLVKTAAAVKEAAKKAKMDNDTEIIQTANGVIVRVKGEALFLPGSIKMSDRAKELLGKLAGLLEQGDLFLTVEGHTDNVPMKKGGFYASNWELSSFRAATVTRHLISRGVKETRIKPVGYADMRPIADNSTREGRSKNRRVEFLIRKGG